MATTPKSKQVFLSEREFQANIPIYGSMWGECIGLAHGPSLAISPSRRGGVVALGARTITILLGSLLEQRLGNGKRRHGSCGKLPDPTRRTSSNSQHRLIHQLPLRRLHI